MSIPESKAIERTCNCKNSKCVKLYCQCFAAKIPCSKNCHCLNCQNTQQRCVSRQVIVSEKKLFQSDSMRNLKGCSCKRSNCMKRYCQCFQSKISCREFCKCIDCHNNDATLNRKVIDELRKQGNEVTNSPSNINLYSMNIIQNTQQINSLIAGQNPFLLDNNYLQKCANQLVAVGQTGDPNIVLKKFLQILSKIEKNITEQNQVEQQYSFNTQQQQLYINLGNQELRKAMEQQIDQQKSQSPMSLNFYNLPIKQEMQEVHSQQQQINQMQQEKNCQEPPKEDKQ